MAKEQWAETAVGAVVIAAAAGFLAYSLTVGGKSAGHGYQVQARFGQVGALSPGAVVSVAGVKVGTVSSITLDPKTYLAVVKLDLDAKTPLPADSVAKAIPVIAGIDQAKAAQGMIVADGSVLPW